MDPEIVKAKLESLSRCIIRIEGRTPKSADELAADLDAQDIIVLNLERAVQLSVDIGSHILLDFEIRSPESMAGVFIALGEAGVMEKNLAGRLSKAAGFRNIAIHDYQAINVEILKTILAKHLQDLEDFYSVILVHFNFAKQ